MMKEKVLIIDDDAEFLEELDDILSAGGYQVETLSDSARALECVSRIKPKVVLLDLKMSPKNGFQIADDLRFLEQRKDLSVIAMSAYFTQKEHLYLMNQCGIEAFLTKPLRPLNVIAQLEFTLGRRAPA